MKKFNNYYRTLAVLLASTAIGGAFATDSKDKETDTGTPTTAQTPQVVSSDKVEPLGLESGKIVDGPANLADKVGKEVERVGDQIKTFFRGDQ